VQGKGCATHLRTHAHTHLALDDVDVPVHGDLAVALLLALDQLPVGVVVQKGRGRTQ